MKKNPPPPPPRVHVHTYAPSAPTEHASPSPVITLTHANFSPEPGPQVRERASTNNFKLACPPSSICHLEETSSRACINVDPRCHWVGNRSDREDDDPTRGRSSGRGTGRGTGRARGKGRGTQNKPALRCPTRHFAKGTSANDPPSQPCVPTTVVARSVECTTKCVDKCIISLVELICSCSTTVDFGFGLTHADTGDPAIPTEGILALLLRPQKTK